MIYCVKTPKSEDFLEICSQLEETVVKDNLRQNGGTLNFSNLTYHSDILIVGFEGNTPVAFNSLIIHGSSLYVYQIAVKKEYQEKGIGKYLIDRAKQLASTLNLDVTAHVKKYNIASQKMFESCGFFRSAENSDDEDYFYRYKTLVDKINKERGLK